MTLTTFEDQAVTEIRSQTATVDPDEVQTATVEPHEVKRLRAAVERIDPYSIEATDTRGFDGITMRGAAADLSSTNPRAHEFEAWSPISGERAHDFFALLLRAAREHLPEEKAQVRIELIEGYLDLGLPIRDLGGDPHRIRIFGGLSAGPDEDGLRALFDRLVAAGRPVVVDMTNFERMGTILYPIFRDLHDRRPDTRWVAGRKAFRPLLKAGVPRDCIEISAAELELLQREEAEALRMSRERAEAEARKKRDKADRWNALVARVKEPSAPILARMRADPSDKVHMCPACGEIAEIRICDDEVAICYSCYWAW